MRPQGTLIFFPSLISSWICLVLPRKKPEAKEWVPTVEGGPPSQSSSHILHCKHQGLV